MKKKSIIVLGIIVLCLGFLGMYFETSGSAEDDKQESTPAEPVSAEQYTEELTSPEDTSLVETPTEPITTATMSIHYLDVGQGDCTLVICGDEAMLIDAGKDNQGTKIQYYLMKHGVEKIKYLILTHSDSDHIGSADVIITKFEIENIIMNEFDTGTATYDDLMSAMEYKAYKPLPAEVGDTYYLGDAGFRIVYPYELGEESNNNSISLVLTHGKNTFLFTGDADYEAENKMIASEKLPQIDVLKAGHHGSKYSSSEELLTCIYPQYAIISVGRENDYGHPHQEVLDRFKSMDIRAFRTDEQGNIVVLSDGSNLDIEVEQADEQADEQAVTYVCNTNTKKFHIPECDSVKEMKEKNRMDVSLTRDEIIDLGYIPCGRCTP